jgi:hypothetical protein
MISRAKDADLEAWESALRAAVLAAGARALEPLLDAACCGRRDTPVMCACGARMQSEGVRGKKLLTILGPVAFRRTRFQCPACGESRFPDDETLNVAGTSFSPALRRMMARAGSKATFKESADDLKIYAGVTVGAKDVERVAEATGEAMEQWARAERDRQAAEGPWRPGARTTPILYVEMDGTGVPMVADALEGRRGKQPDGSAKTRESKIGCVFTQTATDEKGRPVRDPETTSFTGAIETADAFGERVYAEALRRGMPHAEKTVVLGDGAEWIRNITEMRFPQALQIIDLYHAREHVSDLAKLLFTPDEKRIARYRLQWWSWLDAGHIEKITDAASGWLPTDTDTRKKGEQQIAYLNRNKEKMRYADFRKQGLFVGSGVVEAACKTIVAQRLKQSGMEWSVRGANAIISLRCMTLSHNLEDFWESASA